MTTCSTLLAMGMMPLCLFVYTKMWTDSDAIVLPYNSIGEPSEPALYLLTLLYPPSSNNSLYICTILQSHKEIATDFLKIFIFQLSSDFSENYVPRSFQVIHSSVEQRLSVIMNTVQIFITRLHMLFFLNGLETSVVLG